MDGWTGGWMNQWMDEWMKENMDGWMVELMYMAMAMAMCPYWANTSFTEAINSIATLQEDIHWQVLQLLQHLLLHS